MKSIILFSTLLVFSACKGLSQPEKIEPESSELSIGEKIEKLGKSSSLVFQDSQGNYWFASYGAVKYDGKTLTRFSIKDGLFSNRVRDFQEDHLGNIYFDTGSGINKFDGESIIKLKVVDDSAKARMLEPNDLWFAGEWNMNGAYRCDGENLYHLKLPKHPLEEETRRGNPNVSFSLYSSYTTLKDNDGNIWLGGCTFGACRFDGTSFTWVSDRQMTEIDPGPAPGVRSILQDDKGDFYFSSNVTSKYRMVVRDGISEYEKLDGIETSKEPDAESSYMSIVQDDHGDFWMAQYMGGVWKYDGNDFTHYPVLQNNEEAELFSIYKDRQGVLWLGTRNAGAYRFNGVDFEPFEPELSDK